MVIFEVQENDQNLAENRPKVVRNRPEMERTIKRKQPEAV